MSLEWMKSGSTWLERKWKKLPVEWRIEITSASQTFASVFITEAALAFSSGDLNFTRDAIAALFVSALRSAVKAVINGGFGKHTINIVSK